MMTRVACPDCGRMHGVVARPPGAHVVRCSGCGRLWPAADDSPHDGDEPYPRAPWLRLVPFWEELPDAFAWAVRGNGALMIGFFWVGSFLPFVSWLVPVLLLAYAVHALRVTAHAPGDPPEFPEADDIFQAVLWPVLRVLAVFAIAFAPSWLTPVYADGAPAWLPEALRWAAVLVFPILLLLAACTASIGAALNPVTIAATIRAMGRDYLALLLVFAVAVVLDDALQAAAFAVEPIGWIHPAIRSYLVITTFHLFGRGVWQTRDRVDWEV